MPRPDRTPTGGDRATKVAKIQKAGAAAERRRSSMIWGAVALVLTLIVGAVVAAYGEILGLHEKAAREGAAIVMGIG